MYNICWEDSDIDRKLLQINSNTDLLTITSAGCNVLNYLLDSPNSIHCLDINPKQTALLELKVAFIKYGDFDIFFEFFGIGKSMNFKQCYKIIRNELSPSSKAFWDSRIQYFNPNGKGLFYSGAAGLFAQFLNQTINRKGLRDTVKKLVNEKSRDNRNKLFLSIEKRLWNGFESKLWKSPLILSLAGVPKNQQEAIGDINKFMKHALQNVFIEQTPSTNFFWRVYLEGSFSKKNCPDYLKKENFELLQKNIARLNISTSGINGFLSKTNRTFTHAILLDYMDWLVGNYEVQLSKHWINILKRSKPDSKILFRTAYPNADFIPDFVKSKISLQQVDKDWVAKNDKVGTYSGTYLGVVI